VRETFGIERAENLRLRDFPTLRHVVKFVYDHRPDLAAATAVAVPDVSRARGRGRRPVPAAGSVGATSDAVAAQVLAIIAEKTGYPPDMLEMDLDLEADLGVTR